MATQLAADEEERALWRSDCFLPLPKLGVLAWRCLSPNDTLWHSVGHMARWVGRPQLLGVSFLLLWSCTADREWCAAASAWGSTLGREHFACYIYVSILTEQPDPGSSWQSGTQ